MRFTEGSCKGGVDSNVIGNHDFAVVAAVFLVV
jgi:hypothetical protein